jgi:hypothetical protein
MDFLWQISWEEMLGDLIVTSFVILLPASIVVVCLMVMFPLIDLAFKNKSKSTPRPAQVETSQFSGRPWLALRKDFSRSETASSSLFPLVGMAALVDPPVERITPLVVRPTVRKGFDGAPTEPVAIPPEQPGRPSRAA